MTDTTDPSGAGARWRIVLEWIPALAFALSVLGAAYWAGGFTKTVADHESRIHQLEQQQQASQEIRDRLTRIEAKVDAMKPQAGGGQ